MMPEQKFTTDELRDLFGDEIPIEVITVIWNSPPETTIAQVREKVRAMAGPPHVQLANRVVSSLCRDPEVWATHGIPGEHKLQKIRDAIADALQTYAASVPKEP